MRQYQLALDHLAQIEKTGKDMDFPLLWRADLRRRIGKFDDAVADCKKAVSGRAVPISRLALASTYLDWGDTLRSADSIRRYHECRVVLDELYATSDGRPYALSGYGKLAQSLSKLLETFDDSKAHEPMLTTLEEMQSLDKVYSHMRRPDMGSLLERIGRRNYEEGRYEVAVKFLETALSIQKTLGDDPIDAIGGSIRDLHWRLSSSYLGIGSSFAIKRARQVCDEGIETTQRSYERDPKDASAAQAYAYAIGDLADLEAQVGNLDAAYQRYKQRTDILRESDKLGDVSRRSTDDLLWSSSELIRVARQLGRNDVSNALFAESLRLTSELAADKSSYVRAYAAASYSRLGGLALDSFGDPNQALDLWQRNLSLLESSAAGVDDKDKEKGDRS